MVHVSFLEPTHEKVHRQRSRSVCAKTRSGLSDGVTNKKGTSGLVENEGLHTRFKASHAIFPIAECGPRFLHTWNCKEERGLTVSFASTLSRCHVWSAHCMRVIATVRALTNRLAHVAGSFLIRPCREFSHPGIQTGRQHRAQVHRVWRRRKESTYSSGSDTAPRCGLKRRLHV